MEFQTYKCKRTVQMTVMMITNTEEVGNLPHLPFPLEYINYNKRKILVTIWWIETFIHRRCRLLVSRNTIGVNKSDFARCKRKIPMPEIDRGKKFMAYLMFIYFEEFDMKGESFTYTIRRAVDHPVTFAVQVQPNQLVGLSSYQSPVRQ